MNGVAGPWADIGGSEGKLSIEPVNDKDEPGIDCGLLLLTLKLDECPLLFDAECECDSFRSFVSGGGSDGGANDGGGWDGGGISNDPIAGLCGVVNGENDESI